MKKELFLLVSTLVLVIFLTEISLAADYSLSNSEAKSLVKETIKYGFFPVRIGKFVLVGKKAEYYKKVLSKLDSAKVVDYQVVPSKKKCSIVGGGGKEKGLQKAYEFNVTLTDEASKYGYFHSEQPKDIIGLIVGDRDVLEIIDIERIKKKAAQDIGFVIHFHYSFDSNSLGDSLGASSDKRNRGKLICAYSLITERLIVYDFQYSSGENGKWKFGTFSDELDDKLYFRARYLSDIYRGTYFCK